MKNITGMNEDDAHRLHMLMELAPTNQWYMVAEHLRRARDELRERLKMQWADGIIHDLEHGDDGSEACT